ncbi:F-box protein At1g59680 [Eutrema salsugineum]|uniref:F-box protein At1g59680 n=1 Tax=Eutrema salsugineum TaxID=72664 RepID=UPI000CED3F98|nr:F-box protein At1g59680 [Eutrema salsugineum]
MTTISDLSGDLVGEILTRVPLPSLSAVRSTCKSWNALSKTQIFGKAARKQFLGFMVMNFKVCSMRLDLQGYFFDLSIKPLHIFNQVEIAEVFHCYGLLLCVTNEEITRLVVWNPYSSETRWIQPVKSFCRDDMFTFGYDNNNRNHKILRLNAYIAEIYDSEKFGPHLDLPSESCSHVLSCVRDEKLASLLETSEKLEFWITTKIDTNLVSWNKFLSVDKRPLTRFLDGFMTRTFLIDEEKKVVVVSGFRSTRTNTCPYQTAHIIGENGYFKCVNIGEARKTDQLGYYKYNPLVFSSYVPSLVQLKGENEVIN